MDELSARLSMVGKLSNLALQLYGWYIKYGHARDEEDIASIKSFYQSRIPENVEDCTGFYEKLYLSQSQAWYGFILQDLLMYYKHCQRWVDLFEREPNMIKVEPQHYIKGMHNLLNAHFMLRNDKKFESDLERFEMFCASKEGESTVNNRVQGFVYLYLAKINMHFMQGSFSDGLKLVPIIEEKISSFEWQLDKHRILVFYYKIACLYFGSSEYEKAIEYLNKIIHWKADLRSDIQCYARLLHLISHFELGNDVILESQIRSVYRFMSNMKTLSTVETKIFGFLRKVFTLSKKEIKQHFNLLLEELKPLENNPLESRSFLYLDILSWLESKITEVPVQDVIAQKFLQKNRQKI